MKSRVISLYSAMLNTHYGLSAGKYYYIKKKQRLWEPLVIVASMGWLLVLAVWFAWMLTEQLFLGGLAFGQPHLALISGTLIVSVLGLFFGFFNVLSTFYFSNDLSILLAWPLRSWEILLAKLGVIVTGQYVLNALFLLPIGIRYGLLARVGVGYVVSAFVVFLVLPVIPLVIASALSVVLMRLVNLSRYRDKLTLIGGILLLVIVFGGTYWLQQNVETDDPSVLLEKLLSQADGLVKAVGRVFPPSVWAAQAMAYAHTSQGWINLLYLVASSALGLIVLYVLGEKVFLQGVIAGLEGSRGGKRRKKVVLEHVERGAFLTLLSTERKLFVRDPNFALNGLIGYVLLPVMALLPLFGQNLEGNPFEQLNFGEMDPLLVMGGISLFFMVMIAMSMIPSTTFSREGRYLWIVRTLPLSIGQIIRPRVAAAQVVNTVGCVLGLLPLSYLFGWGVLEVGFGIVFGLLLSSVVAYLLVILDLSRPMLDWINPIKAVKSNFNSIVGMFGTMVIAFLLGALFFLNARTATLWLIPLELLLVTGLLGGLAWFLTRNVAPKLWAKI